MKIWFMLNVWYWGINKTILFTLLLIQISVHYGNTGCWFLSKNLSNFVSPVWKLHHCHAVHIFMYIGHWFFYNHFSWLLVAEATKLFTKSKIKCSSKMVSVNNKSGCWSTFWKAFQYIIRRKSYEENKFLPFININEILHCKQSPSYSAPTILDLKTLVGLQP